MKVDLIKFLWFFTYSVVVFFSCKKVDYSAFEEEVKSGIKIEKFFDSHLSKDEDIRAISTFIKNENKRYGFLNSIISTVGYPRWDKTISIKNVSESGRQNTEANQAFFYIPFVRDSQNFVNASLVVRLSPLDTTIRWLCDWQYNEFSFDTTNTVSQTAQKVFQTFAALENNTFGHNSFLVNDGRILGYSDTQRLKVNIEHLAGSGRNFEGRLLEEVYYSCQRMSVCVVAGSTQTSRNLDDPNSTGGCQGTLHTTLYCNVFIFGTGGAAGGNSGWTHVGSGFTLDQGGAGGSGTPGGGTVIEGWSPLPNPCNTTTRGFSIQNCISAWEVVESIDNPCDKIEPLANDADYKMSFGFLQAKTLENKEYAYVYRNSASSYILFEGQPNTDNVSVITFEPIPRMIHSHLAGGLPIFSSRDFEQIASLNNKGFIDLGTFTYGLATQTGSYILTIEDPIAFQTFLANYMDFATKSREFELEFQGYKIGDYSNNDDNIIAFLKLMQDYNTGIAIIKANSDYTVFSRLSLFNNTLISTPCN